MSETAENTDNALSYVGMFEQYLAGQTWIGPAELPLVHHLRQLCRRLDDDEATTTAAMSSSYLQAFARLDRRRPGAAPPVPGDVPGQTSIFDHLD